MNKEDRLIKKSFRLHKNQFSYLQNMAEQNSMSMSKYIRLLIDADRDNNLVKERNSQNILRRDLINEINHIGININQIARNHNAQLYSEHDKRKLYALMKKLNEMISQALQG